MCFVNKDLYKVISDYRMFSHRPELTQTTMISRFDQWEHCTAPLNGRVNFGINGWKWWYAFIITYFR